MTERTGYSGLQIALHWLVAALILGAFFTKGRMEDALELRIASGATGTEGNTAHVWMGGLAFVLVAVRIVVRLRSGAPGPVAGTSPMMALAVKWGHRLLYALMVATPLTGALTWYGGIDALGDVHETVGQALMIVILGHILAAMLHEALRGDGTMNRMFSPQTRG